MRFSEINKKIVEGYKLQLERDADMMVLNITDTATGKRTEVRGKSGYESGNYDANDKLHQLLDRIGKASNISDLMNGEVVGINPKHPDGASAKKHTDTAFNEEVEVSLHGDAKKGYVLSKIKVSGDERNAGQGTKAMQDIVDRMDREGAVIALTPDDAFGGNKNRLIKFYKRFGFVPNKGRNKDFRFRETMIRYPQSNESLNELSKEEFDAIRNGYVDIEFDKKWWPLSSDYPLIKHIGEAIGATSWTSWGKVGVPWSETEMIGGGGTYMLKGDFGHILLDASRTYRPDGITMAQISTSNRGDGVGTKVMNAIKQYTDKQKLPFTVYKVTNVPFFKKFSWLTQKDAGTFVYDPTKNESINEALDNPYPFELIGPNDSQEFSALAQTPNGMLRMDFEATDYDNFGIDFSVGKSMGKTEAGDEFKVFATVVAMMTKWIKTVGIEHVESFDFGANKDEHASDGRAKLYTRFAKQLASKLGWKLEQSTTANNSTAFFRLVNPKPIPREQEYWDTLEENVIESAGVGRVVKGVNTTVDVGPNEIIKQVKKYGNDVDRNGKPNKHLR